MDEREYKIGEMDSTLATLVKYVGYAVILGSLLYNSVSCESCGCARDDFGNTAVAAYSRLEKTALD